MANSVNSSAKQNAAEEYCAGCNAGPLESSLCMACEHRLCLSCASQQLRMVGPGRHAAQCPLCSRDTEVNTEAAAHLLALRGSGGSVGAPAARGPTPSAASLSVASAPSADPPATASSAGSRVREPRPQDHVSAASLSTSQGAALASPLPRRDVTQNLEPPLPLWQLRAEPGHSEAAAFGPGRGNVADTVKLSEAERNCGQCQAALAEIECWECGERFCARCSAFIHKRGRLKEHTLMPFNEKRSPRVLARGPRLDGTSAAGELHDGPSATPSLPSSGRLLDASQLASPSQASAAATMPAGLDADDIADENGSSQRALSPIFGGRMHCCPVHPEDPLQFFCLTCENQECICAECAVHGAHRGHDVLNVRHAHKQLSAEIVNVLNASQVRQEEHSREMQRATAARSEVDLVIAKGKRAIQEMFEKMRASLSRKEAELLQASDQVERLATAALARRTAAAEGHVRALQQAQAVLRRLDNRGDEVKVLNTYASARGKVVRVLSPLEGLDGDVEQELEDLKMKVQQSLELQVSEVATLGNHVSEIRGSRPASSPQMSASSLP
mmetsp:Transcript_118984/g.210328  ORF Transcript_118984/g.210328 Transcript_118984/m.210328 type:complete len:558 (+) Transcript_118984:59-1732(+)